MASVVSVGGARPPDAFVQYLVQISAFSTHGLTLFLLLKFYTAIRRYIVQISLRSPFDRSDVCPLQFIVKLAQTQTTVLFMKACHDYKAKFTHSIVL